MPYLFGILVLLNAVALGYFIFVHQPTETVSVQSAKSAIAQPMDFANTSKHAPPLIGTKD